MTFSHAQVVRESILSRGKSKHKGGEVGWAWQLQGKANWCEGDPERGGCPGGAAKGRQGQLRWASQAGERSGSLCLVRGKAIRFPRKDRMSFARSETL